jgi:hypothetical protein
MTGELVRNLRAQGAHDGRSASVRIDRVEAQNRAVLEVLVQAFGQDALRAKLGDERALAVLEAAHYEGRDQIRAKWAAERQERERAVAQQSVIHNGFDGDPAHDERVTSAIMAGASREAVRQILGQVAEYAGRARAEAAAASRRDNFMWKDQSGRERLGNAVPAQLGVATDYTGNPRQRTVVHNDVAELASEPVTPPDMGDVREVVRTCSGHEPRPGEKFCPACGKARPA